MPAAHCTHCVADVAAMSPLNVPVIQAVQVPETLLPDPVLYAPLWQAVQLELSIAPNAVLKYPAAQYMQLDKRAAPVFGL